MKANEMIDSVVEGQDPTELIEMEVQKSSDSDRVTITDKKSAAARSAVEKHFKALGKELEKLGVKFTARVDNNYASIDINR